MQFTPRVRMFGTAGIVVIGALIALALMVFALGHGPLADTLERAVGAVQNASVGALGDGALQGWRLYVVAFAGGLVSSFSPCILGMLPVNLSYIGAAGLRSRRAATVTALTFVLGVVTVNVVLGLASSLFFAVFVENRAYVNVAVGIITVVMGLWMGGLITLRLPSAERIPAGAGPFVVGVVFALVASPCASPVLIAVLGAAAKDGSPLRSGFAMGAYALGYTAILFAASLFTGIAMSSRRLLEHGTTITRFAAAGLVLVGLGTVWYGMHLF
ncbi:MAG: cytochrome c biogenesis CcdA family protein [Candidatus Elarobacter sp.]